MQNNNTLYEQSPTLAIYFQKLKGIYKTNSNAIILEDSIQQKQYIDYLLKNGLQINNLRLAQFKTKNGLPYTGLIATKNIEKQSILVHVPKQLMLTTKKAFFSPIQEIFQKYPQFFSQYHYGGWQDRILLTFLLYQTQFREKSQWYHLIANLPRDIDYLIFWTDEELELLNDPSLVQNAKKNLAEFQTTYETLVLILDQYPQYFQKDTYCYDNIKWIYIHLVSRTFGSKLASDAFVPFCEMFNHENTKVYYTGDTIDAKSEDSEESNGEFDDFVYSNSSKSEFIQLNVEPIKMDFQIESMELEIKKSQILQQFQAFKLKYRNNQLVNKYIDTIYKILQSIQVQIHEGQIDLISGLNQVDELIQESQFTFNTLFNDKTCKRQNEQYLGQINNECCKFNAQQILEAKVFDNFQYFNSYETWEEDKFDNFIIKCSEQDSFAENSQVFFSYGKLSNRNLLLRYGFALEYNIYDDVFVRISENSTTKNCPFSFKIGYNKICEELLLYFKLSNCKSIENLKQLLDKGKQMANYAEEIQQTIQLLQQFRINYFKQSLPNLEKKLQDEQLGYHGHFALIFRIERLRIIDSQIEAFQVLQAQALGKDFPQTQYPWTSRLVDRLIQGQ